MDTLTLIRRGALAALFVLGSTATVAAQTHPCDFAPQLTATKGTRVGFCSPSVDDAGVAVGAFNFRVYVNNALALTWTNATPTVLTPNGAGLYYFEYPLPSNPPRGKWPVNVQQYVDTADSALSDTALWQVGGNPIKPKIMGIKP